MKFNFIKIIPILFVLIFCLNVFTFSYSESECQEFCQAYADICADLFELDCEECVESCMYNFDFMEDANISAQQLIQTINEADSCEDAMESVSQLVSESFQNTYDNVDVNIEDNDNSYLSIAFCEYIDEVLYYRSEKLVNSNFYHKWKDNCEDYYQSLDESGINMFDIGMIIETEPDLISGANNIMGILFDDLGWDYQHTPDTPDISQPEIVEVNLDDSVHEMCTIIVDVCPAEDYETCVHEANSFLLPMFNEWGITGENNHAQMIDYISENITQSQSCEELTTWLDTVLIDIYNRYADDTNSD